MSAWLAAAVKQLKDEAEKASGVPFAADVGAATGDGAVPPPPPAPAPPPAAEVASSPPSSPSSAGLRHRGSPRGVRTTVSAAADGHCSPHSSPSRTSPRRDEGAEGGPPPSGGAGGGGWGVFGKLSVGRLQDAFESATGVPMTADGDNGEAGGPTGQAEQEAAAQRPDEPGMVEVAEGSAREAETPHGVEGGMGGGVDDDDETFVLDDDDDAMTPNTQTFLLASKQASLASGSRAGTPNADTFA
eukprot:gene1624-1506_t